MDYCLGKTRHVMMSICAPGHGDCGHFPQFSDVSSEYSGDVCVIEPVSASSYQLLVVKEGSSLTALWGDFSDSYCRGNSSSLHGNKPFRSVFSTRGWGDKTDDLWGCIDKNPLHYTDAVYHCTSSSSSEIQNILSLFWWWIRWNNIKKIFFSLTFHPVYSHCNLNKVLTLSGLEVQFSVTDPPTYICCFSSLCRPITSTMLICRHPKDNKIYIMWTLTATPLWKA